MLLGMSHVHRFHIPAEALADGQVVLREAEAHHALHVVRVRKGEEIALFDGQGRELTGQVSAMDRREVVADITGERNEPRPEVELILLQAWLHRDKAVEELIKRATEIGVARFRFFRSERSERPLKQNDKWRRWAVEACKQCGRLWLPEFEIAKDLSNALDGAPDKVLLASMDLEPVPIREAVRGQRSLGLLIGPEGDFSDAEIEAAQSYGATPISLGRVTFRAEVAAFLASALVLYELSSFSLEKEKEAKRNQVL
jgi:16S rRNA (uracil1498-N3)-methyltransferase